MLLCFPSLRKYNNIVLLTAHGHFLKNIIIIRHGFWLFVFDELEYPYYILKNVE